MQDLNVKFETARGFLQALAAAQVGLVEEARVIIPGYDGVWFYLYPNRGRIKLILESENSSWKNHFNPFNELLRDGEYEIHPDLIKNLDMFSRVIIFSMTSANHWDKVKPDLRGQRPKLYVELDRLCEILVFTQSARLQNKLIDRLEGLRHERHNYYFVPWVVEKGQIAEVPVDRVPWLFTNAMNPDHLGRYLPLNVDLKGLTDTPVYEHVRELATVDDKPVTRHFINVMDGNVSKAMARHKLSYTIAGAYAGDYDFFIITNMSKGAAVYHAAGGMYTPRDIFNRYGASRVTNKFLIKGVLQRQPNLVEEEFPNEIVCGKNVFKGELRGLKKALGDELAFETRKFMGHDVTGVHVRMPMYVTNLIVGYGISVHPRIKEDPKLLENYHGNPVLREYVELLQTVYIQNELEIPTVDDDVANEEDGEDEVKPASASAYLYMMDKMNKVSGWDPAQFVRVGISEELFEESETTVDIKAFDVMNVMSSYGVDVARTFVKSIHDVRRVSELNQYLLGSLKVEEIPADLVYSVAMNIWGDPDMMATKLDPERLLYRFQDKEMADDYAQRFVDAYLNGSKNKFNGILGEDAKTINIQGYEFYIPSGKIQKMFVYPERNIKGDKTGRYFFNGSAMLVNELFKLIARYEGVDNIPFDHLRMFYLWYYAQMQKTLYRYYGENIRVKGYANKMIVAHCGKQDTIYCFDSSYRKYDGATVVFKKTPSLFNKAVHGIKYSMSETELGFSIESEADLFALKSCVYVPIDVLLAHQNDTDGDLGTVMFLVNHGIPVFTGKELPKYMHAWAKEYISGEFDLEIKPKDMKRISLRDLTKALKEAWKSKKTIGRATNMANIIGMLGLSRYGVKFGPMRDGLMMMVQELIRGIKHKDGKNVMLDYLSRTSFGQIYGYEGPYSSIKQEISRLHSKIYQQVGFVDDGIHLLAAEFPKQLVRRSAFKDLTPGDSFPIVTKIPDEFKFLNMYIGTWAARAAQDLVPKRINYESFEMYPDRQWNHRWAWLLENFETIQDNLIFCSKIPEPKTELLKLLKELMS